MFNIRSRAWLTELAMSFAARLAGRWRQLSLSRRQGRPKSNSAVEAEGPEPPNGFLFNEKVALVLIICSHEHSRPSDTCVPVCSAPSSRRETSEGAMGEHICVWYDF